MFVVPSIPLRFIHDPNSLLSHPLVFLFLFLTICFSIPTKQTQHQRRMIVELQEQKEQATVDISKRLQERDNLLLRLNDLLSQTFNINPNSQSKVTRSLNIRIRIRIRIGISRN